MPDLRYHLISLISVFLALAIGILLGVAMADRGVISDRLQAEITGVQDQLEVQRTRISEQEDQIAALQERTARDEALAEQMSETILAGRLQGVNVALVAGPWAGEETVQGVERSLSTAGVDLTANIRLEPPEESEITPPRTTAGTTTASSANIYDDQALEVLGTSGSDSPEVIVFIGGGEVPEEAPAGSLGVVTRSQRAMLESWLAAGARVIGAESSTSPRTEIQLFDDVGIPSVDNADQAAGRAAIVQLADGEAEGSYGVKPGASGLFPPPN